jgi:phosphatidylglycerophosphate synthase
VIGPHQIPNALCVGRVIVVYVAMYFLLDQYYTSGTVSAIWLGVAAVGALTDKLDG